MLVVINHLMVATLAQFSTMFSFHEFVRLDIYAQSIQMWAS